MIAPFVRLEQTGWGCPSQWEALDESGAFYYVRYRWGILTVDRTARGAQRSTEVFRKRLGDDLDGILSEERMLAALKEKPVPRTTSVTVALDAGRVDLDQFIDEVGLDARGRGAVIEVVATANQRGEYVPTGLHVSWPDEPRSRVVDHHERPTLRSPAYPPHLDHEPGVSGDYVGPYGSGTPFLGGSGGH